jgi:hypothetical protein
MKVRIFIIAMLTHLSARADVTQWPVSCLKKNIYPCAVHAYKKTSFDFLKNKLYVSKNSLFEFNSSDKMTLYQGVALVKHEGPLTIEMRYGSFHADQKTGDVLMVAEGSEHSLHVLKGFYQIKARGEGEYFRLSPGLQAVMGPVDYKKKATFLSLPTVIDFKKYLKSVDNVFPYSEMNFQEHVDLVAKTIQQATLKQAKWNKTIVERKIAQTQELELRQRYESEYAKKREEYLRRLFRRKNNFEED